MAWPEMPHLHEEGLLGTVPMTDGLNSFYGALWLCDRGLVSGADEAPSPPGLQALLQPYQASSPSPHAPLLLGGGGALSPISAYPGTSSHCRIGTSSPTEARRKVFSGMRSADREQIL